MEQLVRETEDYSKQALTLARKAAAEGGSSAKIYIKLGKPCMSPKAKWTLTAIHTLYHCLIIAV